MLPSTRDARSARRPPGGEPSTRVADRRTASAPRRARATQASTSPIADAARRAAARATLKNATNGSTPHSISASSGRASALGARRRSGARPRPRSPSAAAIAAAIGDHASRSSAAARSGGTMFRGARRRRARGRPGASGAASMSIRQQKCSAPRGAVRTHRFSGGIAPSAARSRPARRAAARRRSARRPRSGRAAGAARACSWYGRREPYGAISTASSSIATIALAPPHLLLHQVVEQVAAHRARRVGGEALALAGDRRRHEVQRVELGVGVRQRGSAPRGAR